MSTATDTLKSTFQMLGAMTSANLQGVSSQAADTRPTPTANNARWVLGHIVFWRNRIVALLGGQPLWGEGEYPEFEGRKQGDPPDRVGRAFGDLLGDLERLQERTLAALDGDVPDVVRGDVVSLSLHEAYHVGQLGLLRRTMGLPGAI